MAGKNTAATKPNEGQLRPANTCRASLLFGLPTILPTPFLDEVNPLDREKGQRARDELARCPGILAQRYDEALGIIVHVHGALVPTLLMEEDHGLLVAGAGEHPGLRTMLEVQALRISLGVL